jgi:hypothetical protein
MNPQDTPFANVRDQHQLPFDLDGSFGWLMEQPVQTDDLIAQCEAGELRNQLSVAEQSAASSGVSLPPEFTNFLKSSEKQRYVRSATGCYLDLAQNLLPLFDGYLLRFLLDSQGFAFWYLYLNRDGSDHCVVISYEYFDADEMDREIDEISESDLVFDSPDFETFLCRYWLENEIMFANCDGTPLPSVDREFTEAFTLYEDD